MTTTSEVQEAFMNSMKSTVGEDKALQMFEQWFATVQGQQSEQSITVPRPHVNNGPQGVPANQADARYLRKAAHDIENHYKPFGSTLRGTVVKLLNDSAEVIEPSTE